jgi:3',5'-cyclic AMP phosphodiesterase CpdA
MRTILHLSDLHFGRTDPALLRPLIDVAHELRPDVVAVSGDLTQRAKRDEFREAQQFLAELPGPQIVVPGNHDVPLHNVLRRFVEPLGRYRRFISDDCAPFHHDEELAIGGINTARALTVKGGRINRRQVSQMVAQLAGVPSHVIKVIVTHHPFDLPGGRPPRDLVGRAASAMAQFAAVGADIFLSGHLHVAHTSHTAQRYLIAGHSALVVQAGTVTSTRGRGEKNSFNVIAVDRPLAEVRHYVWDDGRGAFGLSESVRFVHSDRGWLPGTG